jgi:hypothetical protein
MPTVNIQQLRAQAQYLVSREGISEDEAISRVIEDAGINEEFATEINLSAEISRVMNITSEEQREEAEAQLQQQAEASGNTSSISLDTSAPAPAEADTGMQGMAEADPNADSGTLPDPAPTGTDNTTNA